MTIFDAARVLIGTGAMLFIGSLAVGLGLHAGFRLGARWFGAIQISSTKYYYSVTTSQRWRSGDGS